MSVLPIVTYDDEVLRKEAEPITENTDRLQTLIDDMFETMYHSDGVGLAGPQIGRLVRLFVMDADIMAEENDEPTYGPMAMINPEIVEKSGEEVSMDEGCLSIPGINTPIDRPDEIVVEYTDRDFNRKHLKVGGWAGRVIQHETDHLNGVLFLDYLSYFKKKLFSSKLNKIATGKEEVDYPVVPKKAQVQ